MYYEWSDIIKTGYLQIDEQHQALIEHLDQLLKSAEQKQSTKEVLDRMRFFETYVIEHFTDEELLHKESGAPGYESHVKAHQELIRLVDALTQQIKGEGLSALTELKLYNGLVKQFIDQVHQYDVPLASFLKKII